MLIYYYDIVFSSLFAVAWATVVGESPVLKLTQQTLSVWPHVPCKRVLKVSYRARFIHYTIMCTHILYKILTKYFN